MDRYENTESEQTQSDDDSPVSFPPPNIPAPSLPPPLPARVKKEPVESIQELPMSVVERTPPENKLESIVPDPQPVSLSHPPEPMLPSYQLKKASTFKDAQDDEDNDPDGEISQQMTASYSEISFKSGLSMDSPKDDSNPETDVKNFISGDDSAFFLKLERPATLCYDHKSFGPLNLEGTVHVEGNVTHFVAEDLEAKIKLSSPMKKEETSFMPCHSRTGTPSNLFRHLLTPSLTPHDQQLLNDIEVEAQRLATSIDSLTENLSGILHSISSITADNVDIYKDAVTKMSDTMDGNIKSMYTIVAKAEEVSQVMKNVNDYSLQVKEIKRLVDLFETYL